MRHPHHEHDHNYDHKTVSGPPNNHTHAGHHHHTPAGHLLYCPSDDDCTKDLFNVGLGIFYMFRPADHTHD